MRMNLSAHAFPARNSDLTDERISLTIRPAASLSGDYSFVMDVNSLRRLLLRTDLPSTVLEKFEMGIYNPKGARLAAVDLTEKTLTQIGYFID